MAHADPKAFVAATLRDLLSGGPDLGRIEDMLPVLDAGVAEIATPDFACVMCPVPPTPPVTYPGIEGLSDAWEDYGQAFEEVRAEFEGVEESADAIVMFVNQIGVTRHGGVEISQPSAIVFAFEPEGLARIEFHLDREAASRSAGLKSAR